MSCRKLWLEGVYARRVDSHPTLRDAFWVIDDPKRRSREPSGSIVDPNRFSRQACHLIGAPTCFTREAGCLIDEPSWLMHETFFLIAEPFQITREPRCLIDDPILVSDDLSRFGSALQGGLRFWQCDAPDCMPGLGV